MVHIYKGTGMRDIEVDQSGRTDVLTVDTVLAFSNDVQESILIPRSVKQECYHCLKAQGVRKHRIGVKLLTAGLVLLLQDHITQIRLVVIDLEYLGGAIGDIKGDLLQKLRQQAPYLESGQIEFGQIGKKSGAHIVALQTYRGQRRGDKRITTKELLEVLGFQI